MKYKTNYNKHPAMFDVGQNCVTIKCKKINKIN